MPVKLGSKLPTEHSEARIEIIPLIDIMFFLLAAFMLVSLSMVNLKGVKVSLPTATTASPETQKNLVHVTVDKNGLVFLDGKPIGSHELATALNGAREKDPDLRVFIRGDREARHGDVLHILDLVRSAGVEKVAFETREPAAAQ
jgi:biopolymer transport protein ExbD